MKGTDRPILRLPTLLQQPAVFITGGAVPNEAGTEQIKEILIRSEAVADLVEDKSESLSVRSLYR